MEVTAIRLDADTFNMFLAFACSLLIMVGFGSGQGWK